MTTAVIDRLNAALDGHYRIERELGAGGMATVYLAHDIKHDRKVALKVLKPELAAVLGAERFVVEIRTTASLSHPHILPLFDSGTADGFLYYVMPYVEGETLRDKLNRETQLAVGDAVRIAREIADALDYAHRHGVIHRDIKPENILLHDGRPMVADFGIALAVSAAAGGRMTETGLSLGTPHYMSPEQATADKEISARSDVYSLGSVLFEMLAGEPPHSGGSAQAIIMKIIAEPAPPVTKFRRSVPAHVAAAVAQAIEKVPADRFASAKAFSEALADVHFTGTAGLAMSAPAGTGGARGLRRALAASLATIAVLVAWIVIRRPPPPPVTAYRFAVQDAGGAMDVNSFAIVSSDGSRIVYRGERSGDADLWVKERGEISASPIRGTYPAFTAVFSPDDSSLAVVQAEFLSRMPARGGSGTILARDVTSVPGALAWTDDGWIYYVSGSARSIRRVRATGGASEEIWTNDSLTVFGLAPLPGKRGVLFIGCQQPCASSSLYAFDQRAGASRRIAEDVRLAQYLSTGHLLLVEDRTRAGVVERFDVRSLELRGGRVTMIDSVRTIGSFASAAVSRNGTLVYRQGSTISARTHELVSIDRAGRQTPLDSSFRFRLTFFAGDYGWRLSPDAKRLAIGLNTETGDDIWIKALPRGPLSRVTSGADAERRPFWHPDGAHVVFVGSNGVYRRRADGTGSDSLLYRGPVNEAGMSPDGQWIVFRTGALGSVSGGRDIYGIRLGVDSTPVPLVVTEFDEHAFGISPDGRWMAYQSNETGRQEVFVRPFPNTRDAKVQVSQGGGIAPRWSRDGRELYFSTEGGELMAVRTGAGAAPTLGEPVRLFTMPPSMLEITASWYTPWDVTPDGRFIMVRQVEGAGAPDNGVLVVVENWFEELRRKLPR